MEEQSEFAFTPEDVTENGGGNGPEHGTEHVPPGGEDSCWLETEEKYPGFGAMCENGEFIAAVKAGERPAEAYLRLENARLADQLDRMKKDALIRGMVVGPVSSSAGE